MTAADGNDQSSTVIAVSTYFSSAPTMLQGTRARM